MSHIYLGIFLLVVGLVFLIICLIIHFGGYTSDKSIKIYNLFWKIGMLCFVVSTLICLFGSSSDSSEDDTCKICGRESYYDTICDTCKNNVEWANEQLGR